MSTPLITHETFTMVGGVAIGVIGVGWMIASAMRDRRYEHMGSQVDYFQKLLDQSQRNKLKLMEDNEALRVKIVHLEREMEEMMGTKLDTIQVTLTDINKKVNNHDKPG